MTEMAKHLEELKRDVHINPSALDVEAVDQAELFFKWAELCVDAKALADRAEAKLDSLESRLQMRAREAPEDFNIQNVTEAAVKAAVKSHPKFLRAVEKFYRLKHRSEMFVRAVAAMEQKKRMIEVLVTLHGQEYFAGPSVPRDLMSEWKKHQAAIESNVLSRQRRRARRVTR